MIGLSLLPILPQECWDYRRGLPQLGFYMGPDSEFQGVWHGDSKVALKSKPVHLCLLWGRKLRGLWEGHGPGCSSGLLSAATHSVLQTLETGLPPGFPVCGKRLGGALRGPGLLEGVNRRGGGEDHEALVCQCLVSFLCS